MAKHTQTICQLLLVNFVSVFDHLVGLMLKGLKEAALFPLSFKHLKLTQIVFIHLIIQSSTFSKLLHSNNEMTFTFEDCNSLLK